MLEVETKIMSEVGLGNHYGWYNGSMGCRHIRIAAAEALPKVLKKHAYDCKIPDKELMNLAVQVASSYEESECSLTQTWCLISEIIRHHIKGGSDLKDYIIQNYPLKPKSMCMGTSYYED